MTDYLTTSAVGLGAHADPAERGDGRVVGLTLVQALGAGLLIFLALMFTMPLGYAAAAVAGLGVTLGVFALLSGANLHRAHRMYR